MAVICFKKLGYFQKILINKKKIFVNKNEVKQYYKNSLPKRINKINHNYTG